jgi:hypothetical protein
MQRVYQIDFKVTAENKEVSFEKETIFEYVSPPSIRHLLESSNLLAVEARQTQEKPEDPYTRRSEPIASSP